MNSIRIRIALIIRQENKVLLVRHKKNGRKYWLLPGGGLEYGETIEDAAIREMKEETNLDVKVGDLLFVCESIPPDRHRQVLNLYYSAGITGGEMRLGNEEILDGLEFWDTADIEKLTIYPDIKSELVAYLKDGTRQQISLGARWE